MFPAYYAKFCINCPFFILHTKKKKGRNITENVVLSNCNCRNVISPFLPMTYTSHDKDVSFFFLFFLSCIATIDIIHTYIYMFIKCLWSRDLAVATGRIPFIILHQAPGWTKFDCGPDLARGPDFGHAYPR